MLQQIRFWQAAALHQRESAGAAQSSGGIGAASPDGLKLKVAHPPQEDCGILMLKCRERAAQRILRPALRIGLDRVREEPIECAQQFRHQFGEREFPDQVCRFRHHVVIAMGQRLAQRFDSLRGCLLPEGVEGR